MSAFPPHYKGLGEQFEKTMRRLPEFSHRQVEVSGTAGVDMLCENDGRTGGEK